MKPTDKQIRWLWEQCGLVLRKGKILESGLQTFDTWETPEGTITFTPDIDLNNLFKYAVPELDRREIAYSLHSGRQVISNTLVHHAECWYWNSETVKQMEKAGLKTRFGITDKDLVVAFSWAISKTLGGE